MTFLPPNQQHQSIEGKSTEGNQHADSEFQLLSTNKKNFLNPVLILSDLTSFFFQ